MIAFVYHTGSAGPVYNGRVWFSLVYFQCPSLGSQNRVPTEGGGIAEEAWRKHDWTYWGKRDGEMGLVSVRQWWV